MTRFLFAAAAASLVFAAPATARDREFTQDGVTYSYTATQQGDVRVIEGTASQGGAFRLVVKNGWVRGYVGNNAVAFRTPNGATPVRIAAR